MSLLRISLFGGLTVRWDDLPLPSIPGPVNRSLFAYLAAYHDRPHTRDLLAGTFWPDLPDDLARRRLSQALWQIGRALAPHTVLLADRDTVQLNPALHLWIDVEQFAKHRAQCTAETTEALEACALCIEQYAGEFLAGYYDEWAFREQERLREQFLAALEQLVAGHKRLGNYEHALTYARRLAAEDPWREEAHREVMRLCHLLGWDGEALRQFEICRRALAEELDVEPSAETAALAAEIAARVDAGEIPHLPAVSRPGPLALLERPDRVPLVGRQAERAELVRYLDLAVTGSGGLVLLAGGAGVGKSRLMQEVARDAEWRGIAVAWGHSCELSAPLPYQPLVEVLHSANLDRLPVIWKKELGRLIPELDAASSQDFTKAPAPEPEEEKGRLLEALSRAFLALGEAGPHLIILEDLHWMDVAGFDALRALLPRLRQSRLLVVCTLRPEELAEQPTVHQSLAALEATRVPRWMDLAPLTVTETEALIQRILALSQPAEFFSQRLHAGTEGNPFFVTETLRALVDEGLLVRDQEGEWTTHWEDATGDYAELPVPRSIAQSIERRLVLLSPTVRGLLDVAAVVGREVEFDLWLEAGERDEETTLAAAEELARRGLLVEANEVLGYRFAHDTIRHVVYKNLSPVRRSRWHRQVASTLEALHPNQVEALARHFYLGQDWSRAVRYALQAGERAQAVYANQQALDHYRLADGWLADGRVTRQPGSEQTWTASEITRWRADLAERQGQVHVLVGDYGSAEAAFARARQAWSGLDDWRGAARVLNRLSFMYFVQSDYVQASDHAAAALEALPEEASSVDLRATSLTYLGLSAWTQGLYADALQPLEEALVLFEQLDTDQYGLARCLNSLGLVYLELGDFAEADACITRSLTLRQQIGDRRGEAWCWHNQAGSALLQGDLSTARESVQTAQAIFSEIQHPEGLASCTQTLAEIEAAEEATVQERQISVRLPRASAPTGRPLQDDEYVTVTWTLSTPEDSAIGREVDRRRQRLLRLLRQAAEQGAAPTVDDLAEALQVSPPTIKRDLAALRQAGHSAHTRGSRIG
jgi:DNA-binding SARP family transcriptional activator/tetratricopeptide (TPR) repeat protein